MSYTLRMYNVRSKADDYLQSATSHVRRTELNWKPFRECSKTPPKLTKKLSQKFPWPAVVGVSVGRRSSMPKRNFEKITNVPFKSEKKILGSGSGFKALIPKIQSLVPCLKAYESQKFYGNSITNFEQSCSQPDRQKHIEMNTKLLWRIRKQKNRCA